MRMALWIAAVVFALIGLFYAFNAYIQFQERGFAEALDIPISVVSLALAVVAGWRAAASRR